MYREADGPDDMRRAVREQIRAGADFVKVMTTGARSNELEDPDPLQLTDAELAAVTDEAHRLGYRVCAHAEGVDGCEAAIRQGVDTIEHGMYLHRRPDLLAAMAASGQVLVPTLSGYYWMAGLGEVIDPADAEPRPDMPPVLAELAVRNLTEGAATMRAASQAGVKIALGSDMSSPSAWRSSAWSSTAWPPLTCWPPRPAPPPRPWAWPVTPARSPKASWPTSSPSTVIRSPILRCSPPRVARTWLSSGAPS